MSSSLDDFSVDAQGTLQDIPWIALPEPNLQMEQDAEWCVVRDGEQWRQIRFHDYEELYTIPGLYERLFYDILKCTSPTTIRRLLEEQLALADISPRRLRAFDLGAGNGMVGEELADMGVEFMVGADILAEAAVATDRDRPNLYRDYYVVDLTDLDDELRRRLAGLRLNCLTCVAALGFGDIPPLAFAEAYNLIQPHGWVAFNIKEDFLTNGDATGFRGLVRRMMEEDILAVRAQRRYQHRLSTSGEPLHYVALVGRKNEDIPLEWV